MTSKTPVEVLLVEDSATDADLTKKALERGKLPSNVYHARDGIEAMEFL